MLDRNSPWKKVGSTVLVIAVVLFGTVTVTGGVAAQSTSEIQWTGAGTAGGDIGATQDLQIETVDGPINFGGNTSLRLRLTNTDNGNSITIIPEGKNYDVTEFEIDPDGVLNYGDGEKSNKEDPTINFNVDEDDPFVNNYPVKIQGDAVGVFANTFNTFNVQLIDSEGNVKAQTSEEKIRAIDYASTPEYNGSALAVNRASGVQSDWHVELRKSIFEPGPEVENSAGEEYFVIDTDTVEYDPEEDYNLYIYPSSTETELKDIIIQLSAGRLDDDQIIDDPVGVPSDSDSGDSNDSDSDSEDHNNDDQNETDGSNADQTVDIEGSPITVTTGGANSISVSELPGDINVTDVSDGGTYSAEEGSILYTDFGSGLPETVTFTLVPGNSYAVGDTIEFKVGGENMTVKITESAVPEAIAGQVESAQYSAVAGDDGELSASDLSDAINDWAASGSANGVSIGAPELSALINYWANN